MPISQTCGGIFWLLSEAGMNSRATSPTPVPIEKVIADSRNGGTLPDASVSSASSAHMATAEKPISVARPILSPVARPILSPVMRLAYCTASKRPALIVKVPICVPTVAWIGAYTPVWPSGANVTIMRLRFFR